MIRSLATWRRVGAVSLGVVGVGMTVGPVPAAAQSPLTGRLDLHVNFGYQVSSEELRERNEFQAYGETARVEAVHDIAGGQLFDGGGHVNVWRQLSVGASFSQTEGTDDTTLTGTVPHPLRRGADRTLDTDPRSLTHREKATHVHVGWLVPLPDIEKLDLRVMGGPTYFNLTQTAVGGVTISEAGGPPFEAVRVDGVVTGEVVKNGWGGHVAVDIRYLLSPNVGLGGFVRFAGGTIDVPVGDRAVTLSVGGLQAGGGLRVKF